MWEPQVCGSVWMLLDTPWWLVFVEIVFGSTGMVLLLRFITEGKIYDKARSSTPGDLFLAGYCANMANYLQTTGLPKTGLNMDSGWHTMLFLATLSIAICLHVKAINKGDTERRFTMLPAQWWHNLIVVPLLAYVIISTLPIVWHSNSAQLWVGAVICFGTWAGLVVWDIKHDNMVQIR